MEKKLYKTDKDCDVEASLQCCRQSLVLEMKRNPIKQYSAVFLVLLVISFASTTSKMRNYVLPSTRSCSDTARLLVSHGRDENFWCDREDNRTDICYMHGDVHLIPGKTVSVELFSADLITRHGKEENIRPYTRKWDLPTMETVDPVTLKSKYFEFTRSSGNHSSVVCDVVHSVPMVLFSAGGFTGNPYHDFQDVLIPLFITSRQYKGEVVFAITQGRDWWLEKFSCLFQQLSHYKVIDLNLDEKIHCFPDATVGLRVHGELFIDPAQMPDNATMKNFQELLHWAFGEPDSDALTKSNSSSRCIIPRESKNSECLLKLVILARSHSRVILNQEQVMKLALKEGFDVEVIEPLGSTDMRMLYRALHSADVMIGVHGAALTHMLFMRPRSVFIQILPLGTDWPALTYYEEPAVNKLDLQYIEYRVTPEESTLSHTFSVDHPAVTDPEAVIAKNWEVRKKLYLQGQDVRISLPKLKLTLNQARKLAIDAFSIQK